MPFRLFKPGNVCRLIICLFLSTSARAQLDWTSDVVVFGTDQDESHPILVHSMPGQFRAFCVRDNQLLSTRRSLDHGNAWEAFQDHDPQQNNSGYAATSDGTYSYLWNEKSGAVWRIEHAAIGWPAGELIMILDGNDNLLDWELYADAEFDPNDTYLHAAALHR